MLCCADRFNILSEARATATVVAVAGPSDQDLIARVAAGDEAALSALYDRYSAAALALAVRIAGERAEGEDALQTVFVRLWQEAARYDGSRGSVAAWIMSSVRNAAIDRRRRRAAHDRAAQQAAGRPLEAAEVLAGADTSRRVRAAIEALPADQRQAIEMAYFQGMSQSEIAKALGQPLGTVKTRMRLGMIKLREVFAGQARSA